MRPDDVGAVMEVCTAALWGPLDDERRPLQEARVRHLLHHDPGGAWVAADGATTIGTAMALRREGLWGLSLFAVAEEHRSHGAGRALLDAALDYGAGAGVGVILSSEHPAAMRRYALAGFDLRPSVLLAGLVRDAPAAPAGVRDGDAADLGWADDVARRVRGAGYGPDLRLMLDRGHRLRCTEGRGWIVTRGGKVVALAALDEQAATNLLTAHLADGAGGETVEVEFLTAGQDWAIRAGLTAGLVVSPNGCVFTRGRLGTTAPWLPSGAFL